MSISVFDMGRKIMIKKILSAVVLILATTTISYAQSICPSACDQAQAVANAICAASGDQNDGTGDLGNGNSESGGGHTCGVTYGACPGGQICCGAPAATEGSPYICISGNTCPKAS